MLVALGCGSFASSSSGNASAGDSSAPETDSFVPDAADSHAPDACKTVGPHSARAGENIDNPSSPTSPSWQDTKNVFDADDAGAFAYVQQDFPSAYLVARDFGFDVPPKATVRGLEVAIRRAATDPTTLTDGKTFIVRGPGQVSTTFRTTAGPWKTAWVVARYGAPNDTWTEKLTGADVSNAAFGVGFGVVVGTGASVTGASAFVDHVELTIHYCE